MKLLCRSYRRVENSAERERGKIPLIYAREGYQNNRSSGKIQGGKTMYFQLKKAIECGSISRKTACRCAIKNGAKNEYIALLLNLSIGIINRLIEIDDSFIDEFDGTEISTL